MFALVDDDDFEWINGLGLWSAHRHKSGKLYAMKRVDRRTLYMHREIMHLAEPHGIADGFIINHIDNNGLNNQKKNLEVLSSADNTRHYHRMHRPGPSKA